MRQEEAIALTKNCFHGEPASCSQVCPFRLDIRDFMAKAEKKRWNAAYAMLRDALIFPAIVSAVCPMPCEAQCRRTDIGDEAPAVRDVEAACLRYATRKNPISYAIPPKDKRVAVIGAGPAGLSCALQLSQKQYAVSVFERTGAVGGSLSAHTFFSAFREDIELQFSALKTEFRLESGIESLETLSGYDAIFVATGAGGNDFGLGAGWNPALFRTERSGVFLGGALCGASHVLSISQGVEASKIMEAFLQTGIAALPYEGGGRDATLHRLPHDGVVSRARVPKATPSGPYTEEEAALEASRCMKCDCRRCLDACEVLRAFSKAPQKIALEAYTDTMANPPFSTCSLTRESYSCNICGYCKSVCPVGVDMGAVFRLARRGRCESGTQPIGFHDFWLRDMEFSCGEAAYHAFPEGGCEYLFFAGCKLGALNPRHVSLSYEFLRTRHRTGISLDCCGAPAYWAGESELLEAHIAKIRRLWEEAGRPVFVFACAYCERIFDEFLPELNRTSIYALLAAADSPLPKAPFDEMAVFDPCASGADEDMRRSVRRIAAAAGVRLVELPEKNRCCGYGGHIRPANPRLYEVIVENRTAAAKIPYIAYCANCEEIFTRRGKDCAHILDLFFGLPPVREIPNLHEKRENLMRVKRAAARWHGESVRETEKRPWDDLRLIVGKQLLGEMDARLILLDDVKEAVWTAETTGEKLFNDAGDLYACCLIKAAVTYWVHYRKRGADAFEIHEVYSFL